MLFALTSSIFRFQFAVTDYRQYPSLAFLCLALAIGIFTLRRKHIDLVAVSALTLYFGLASITMNTVWRTEESFWGQSVRYGGMALAHANYGVSVVRKDPELAEEHPVCEDRKGNERAPLPQVPRQDECGEDAGGTDLCLDIGEALHHFDPGHRPHLEGPHDVSQIVEQVRLEHGERIDEVAGAA